MLSQFNTHKNRVTKLRQEGKSYGEIRNILKAKIPKSTLSYWCRSVSLPAEYQKRIQSLVNNGSSKGRLVALEVNKVKRENYLRHLYDRNKYLVKKIDNKNTAKIALAMLFWGEGTKANKGSLTLGNSSPELIKMFLKLLRHCYSISEDKFTCRVQCRADQNIRSLEIFWARVTGISPKQFRKASVDPRTIGKPSLNKEYKGVCRIDYYSAEIYNELKTICRIFGEI